MSLELGVASASVPRVLANRMLRPSALHATGPSSSNRPKVSWRGLPPSAGTVNRWSKPGTAKPPSSPRNTSVSIASSGGAHCAPSGLGGDAPIVGAASRTCIRKASRVPSRDQARLVGPAGRLVTRAVSPLSIHRT